MLYVNPQFNRYVFTKLYRPFSPHFPYPRKDFIGRNKDVIRVVELIDFSNTSQPEIICIIGPPGIGKSALAKYVGNEMIVNGVIVHYVDMSEFPDGQLKQVLAEKLYFGAPQNVTFDRLLRWASTRYWNNLIVLDNCDECINSQKQAFQEAIEDILDHSDGTIKFLMTSREETVFFEPYHVHKLQPLSEDSACELLEQKIPSVLNETEKKQIAEGTGEVPLALQIIGSLLNIKIAPPTPQEIIAKLKKDPISILSPVIYNSIGLSYNYLDSKLQKIGRYLALFPGSFDATAAINILMFISNSSRSPVEDREHFTNSLNELVTRSLLELDEDTGRYNFHRLIKEFFLIHSDKSENHRFQRAFQNYFSYLLCKLTTLYYDKSPLKALASLDLERHNFLHFMTNINDPLEQALSIYKTSLTCFDIALYRNFLSIQFLPKELIRPVRSITSILGVELSKGTMKKGDFFLHFVNFIDHLASLTEVLKGRGQAINEFKKRVDTIEYLADFNQDSNEQYILFYEHFLKYESELGEDKAKLYFERILKKARGLTCNDGCDYKTMANSYNYLGKYEISVKFYEKALEEEHYDTPVKISILLEIRYLYGVLQDTNKRHETNEKLLNMFPLLINVTSSSVYANMYTFQQYMTFLWITKKESNKIKAISEKMIESLSELGKGDIATIKRAHRLAKELHDHKEFHRAAKVASYILDSLQGLDGSQQQSMSKENVSIHMILGKSAYHSGNYSKANGLFVSIIDRLLVSNQMDENFATCCSYLIYLGNFKYIRDCYSSVYNTELQKVETFAQIFVGLVFIIPFECNNDYKPNSIYMKAPPDLPVEMYPQVIQRSKSKTVSFNAKRDLSLSHLYLPPFPFHPPSTYKTIVILWKKINEAIKYQFFCIFINWLSVFIRLWLVYYFIRLIFRCISKLWSFIEPVFIFIYLCVICGAE